MFSFVCTLSQYLIVTEDKGMLMKKPKNQTRQPEIAKFSSNYIKHYFLIYLGHTQINFYLSSSIELVFRVFFLSIELIFRVMIGVVTIQ